MKHIITILLVTVSLVACSILPTTSMQTTSNTATPSIVTRILPTQMIATNAQEKTEVRDLVENFGKRLQDVSLLAPDAPQEIQEQYSEFVSPTLLEMWMSDVSRAPGRIVSSPWPDHIDITTLTKEGSEEYVISGYIVGVTSVEVVNGGAAAKIPVHLIVQHGQGGWLIAEFAEE